MAVAVAPLLLLVLVVFAVLLSRSRLSLLSPLVRMVAEAVAVRPRKSQMAPMRTVTTSPPIKCACRPRPVPVVAALEVGLPVDASTAAAPTPSGGEAAAAEEEEEEAGSVDSCDMRSRRRR